MLVPEVEALLTSRTTMPGDGEFIRPSYDSFCLSRIPQMVLSLLGVAPDRVGGGGGGSGIMGEEFIRPHVELDGIRKVVLLLVDGLGYDAYLRHSQDGFFGALKERGLVFPITTVFPSTTAAALTTLNTGLTPQEHGLPEWFVYMKGLDMVIASLPFSPAQQGDGRDALLARTDPRMLFSGPSIHQTLSEKGARSCSLIGEAIAGSAYSSVALAGSEVVPYDGLEGLLSLIRGQVEAKTEEEDGRPSYIYAYWPEVDVYGHAYGPSSNECRSSISRLSRMLKTQLSDRLSRDDARDTLIILTADHGQVDVGPSKTLHLNSYPQAFSSLMRSVAGRPIPPSGSPRDMILFVEEEKLDDVQSYLVQRLREEALVIKTSEAVSLGLFGVNGPSEKFLERAGNLWVLPRGNRTVWYRGEGSREMRMAGMHGGMLRDEMLIPFGISRLADLA